MAWSEVQLSANEIAWWEADKPMLSSNALQGIEPSDIEAKWVVGKIFGNWSDPDATDSDYPIYRLYDGFPGLDSRPNTSTAQCCIIINASSSPIDFDWLGIINHSINSEGWTTLNISIADDSAFSVNVTTLYQGNPTLDVQNDHRWVRFTLDEFLGSTPARFINVPWIRVGMQIPGAGMPYIGQLILGRRRQQQFQPIIPWNPSGLVSSMYDRIAPSGARMRQERYRARREMNATFKHSLSTLHDDIEAWWPQIRYGADPFYIHDLPTTSPYDFHMMRMREPALQYQQINACTRTVTIDAIEQGPNYLSLE